MQHYETVVEAINDLKARGFTVNFNLAFDKIICQDTNVCLDPTAFEITAVYRFEGDTNPSDSDIVYAVESKDGSMKGIITSAYGAYADKISNEMVRKLTMHT